MVRTMSQEDNFGNRILNGSEGDSIAIKDKEEASVVKMREELPGEETEFCKSKAGRRSKT